ncbi:acidic fibroblast growth factor binding-domain-containing protein [Chytriomyces sp. MP71]|nr:acidic fibroblast growth factor binding-domain-containing protein [Chytriomyces sp. MP71]
MSSSSDIHMASSTTPVPLTADQQFQQLAQAYAELNQTHQYLLSELENVRRSQATMAASAVPTQPQALQAEGTATVVHSLPYFRMPSIKPIAFAGSGKNRPAYELQNFLDDYLDHSLEICHLYGLAPTIADLELHHKQSFLRPHKMSTSLYSASSLNRGTAASFSSAAKNVVSSFTVSASPPLLSSLAQQSAPVSMAVFFTTELRVDRIAWQLWLAGFTVDQAFMRVVQQRAKQAQKTQQSALDQTNPSIVKNYITSQYRNFELLENYLHRPKLLFSQLIFPLDTETKQYLIDSYYRFEPKVLRELLGKKLSSRAMRKELEDAHEKSGVPVAGCRRMFDNLKRIMKRCEDLDGNIFRIIQTDFLLQNDLASQYSHVIFINFYRLDTTKKKLSNLTFGDFEYLGSVIMDYFTVQSTSAIDDIDMTLAQDARDLKSIIVNHKETLDEFRARVVAHLQKQLNAAQQQQFLVQAASIPGSSPSSSPMATILGQTHSVQPPPPLTPQQYQSIIDKVTPNVFKVILKNIFSIGAGLSYNKELRDVFVHFVEKAGEPCMQLGWGRAECDAFFGQLVESFDKVELLQLHHRKKYSGSFGRLCKAVGLAAARVI